VSLPTYTKNELLDGLTFSQASLHSAFPGTTGANEISGVSRVSANVAAATGGQRSLVATLTFIVPASTVRWVGWWDGSNFLGCTPNGGATPKNFVSLSSTDTIYSPSHGYTDDAAIVFWNGTAPQPLAAGTVYYVRDAATDTFKVATTVGGTAVDLTTASSFGCVVSAIVEKTYAASATHAVTVGTFLVPD
jgi:hypothetical protein